MTKACLEAGSIKTSIWEMTLMENGLTFPKAKIEPDNSGEH